MNSETKSRRYAKRFMRDPTSDVVRILVMRAARVKRAGGVEEAIPPQIFFRWFG